MRTNGVRECLDQPGVFLYNTGMGRPRTRNVAMVNGRITVEQMEWLQERAEELGGNLSAALRQAITDARFLAMARADYRALRAQDPDFVIPRHTDPPGETRSLEWIIGSTRLSETEDLELREAEAEGGV